MITRMVSKQQLPLELPPGETTPLETGTERPTSTRRRKIRVMPQHMAQTCLPYTKLPSGTESWSRKNGDMTTTWQPGYGQDKDGNTVPLDIPYGMVPRLIEVWAGTEAKRTKSRTLALGESLMDFMDQIGIETVSGGTRGTTNQVRYHADLLFSASLTVRIEASKDGRRPLQNSRNSVAVHHSLWLTQAARKRRKKNDPDDQMELLPSTVTLSQEYFDMVVNAPIPVDANTIRKLRGEGRGSPMALDLYGWLTRKMFTQDRTTVIKWPSTMSQFGTTVTPQSSRQAIYKYKQDMSAAMDRVRKAWPTVNAEIVPEGIKIGPGAPDVPPKGWRDDAGFEEQWYQDNFIEPPF